MRAKLQVSLYAIALAAAAAGAYTIAEHAADALEVRTGAAVRGALSRAEIDWAWVQIDGMQATLHGAAPDEAGRFRALAAAGEVLNPLNLRDAMTVAMPTPEDMASFRIEMLRNGDSILVHGLAPDDAGPDLKALGTALPEIEIADLIARSADPAPAGWDSSMALALTALEQLHTVRVVVTPEVLALDGIAPDRETALALETEFGSAASHGVTAEISLQLPRPVLSPFTTRFTLDAAGARFDTCAAESDAGREVILQAAIAAGAPADTKCPAALGAPDPDWSSVVSKSISLIGALGAGSVTLSDLSITVSLPPEAATHPEFQAHIAPFETELPEIYALSVIETAPDDGRDGALRFSATRSPEGLVNLRGPVGPIETRGIVQTLADARFGAGRLHTALQSAANVPVEWPVHVMAAIDALAYLDTGVVTLTPALITIRGKTGDPEAEAQITRALSTSIGPALAHAVSVEYEETLDPVVTAQGPSPEECVTRINAVLAENEVSFPPGSVEIATDGFDTVGAIAEILTECPDVGMEIGGHTDSQGREEMNQLLSQARADAVLNALMERDVLVGTLTTRGYGEAQPVADNSTAAGREANRRIRFGLLGPNGEVLEAQAAEAPGSATESDG